MTNAKTTKRALGSSILALVLCFAMLLGTTYAWFTDSVTSANNVIKSGNLDIELEYWDGDSWENVAGKSNILTNTLWEPGVTEVAYLRVANAGSLALKYQLGINIVSETAGVNAEGKPFLLSDYIQFGVVEMNDFATYENRDAAVAAVQNPEIISKGYTKATSMVSGEELYLALVVWMPTTVGNVANHNGVNVPKIDLGINVVATQVAYEKDSFDTDYDKDVELPVLNYVTKEEGQAAAIKSGDDADSVVANIPANAPEGEYVLEVANKVVNNTDDGASVSLDISLTLNGEKVSGDTIYAIDIPVGNVYLTTVTHKGVALTQATTGADQTYTFENGVLTIYTKSFSPFTFSYLTGDLIAAKAGEQAYALTFDELRTSVNAGNDFSGWTITLMKDIDFGGKEWAPIGVTLGQDLTAEGSAVFSGMLDGNGHTLSNFKVTEGVTYGGRIWASLFTGIYAKDGNTAGVKNLTLENVEYNNPNASVGAIVNIADSDGNSSLEFSNIKVSGKLCAFGGYGTAGLATLMFGSEVTVENVDLDVDIYIPETFNEGYKFLSPCIAQISLRANGHITLTNVDYSGSNFYYPSACKLEDRSTVVPGYNSIWVYNAAGKTHVLGCGGYSGQFYDNGVTYTINGVDYTHADLKKDQKDYPGYMYDYIIRPASFTAYTTVSTAEELKAAVKAGGYIMLGNDIELPESISLSNADFVLDGNGYTITMAEDATNTYALFDITGGKAAFKNVTFDGIKDGAVVRTVNVEFNADNVTAINGNHTQQQGLFRLMGKSTITNCTFKNNTCNMVITLNYDGANNDPQIVDNCVFEGNTCNSTAVVYYVKGAGATINGNKFVDNTVNCNTNGATLYMGFTENNVITNNLFKNNSVTDASTSTRVSGGVFFGYMTEFKNNSFIDNKAANANGDALGNDVCVSIYYTDIDLSGNYWGGSAPVADVNYYVQHKTSGYKVILNDYLAN